MTGPHQLLASFAERGIRIRVVDDQLSVQAPRGSLSAGDRELLAASKASLIAFLQERDASATTASPGVSGSDNLLSFAQQRLWFQTQLEGASGTYNVPACAWLDGELDARALESALGEIARRHDVLRTSYSEHQGEALASVASEVCIPFERCPAQSDSEVEAIAARITQTSFDLATAPLIRAALVSRAHDRHALILCLHHIVADAWSVGVLLRELCAVYDAFREGQQSPLPPLALQYADFSAWQRDRIAREFAGQLDYWRGALNGAPDALELPLDKPRPSAQSYRGAIERFHIEPELAERLHSFARENGATLFSVLMAGYHALLHRYSRQETIVVGYPIANRHRVEAEPLIGFFVNTLPLRADFPEGVSFRELVARVHDAAVDGQRNQDLPFDRIVAGIHSERTLDRNPIFQTMFALQNAPLGELRMGEVRIRPFKAPRVHALFDMYLSMEADGDRLLGEWEYATDLFQPATIRRMCGHFAELLEAALDAPNSAIAALGLLSAAERATIVDEWNATEASWPVDKTLVDLVEERAAIAQDEIALVATNSELTFAELNARANRIAHHLRRLGVGSETLVGIRCPRGPELIAGILGVLKAGGAYVPLDPAYPAERVAYMIEDAGIQFMLTHSCLEVTAGGEIQLIPLDDEALFSVQPDTNPEPIARPENLAYVIYTSGSTGRPKGIMIEHRNAVAFLAWARTVFSANELDGVLASTSVCFDLSIFEIFLPLIEGGTIILAENALALAEHPARERVKLINTVPSAMAELVRSGGVPSSVITVNLAGEPLKSVLVDRIYDLGFVRNVYDLYGPGEDTTYSTYARRERSGRAIIGRPIANTRAYILDASLQPVPVGVPGEIYLAGAGVTRGYLDRPELTVARYLPDPFQTEGKMYKSGDLGRFHSDGNIEYLGRIDHQVKIRGYRIELGEIEAAMLGFSGVRECVAHVIEQNESKRIAAYYAGEAEVAKLRDYLRIKLPGFMVPGAFLRMDALPMTPNGKIDRKALPPIKAIASDVDVVAPRDDRERILAEVWSSVLGLPQVGIHDNFFEVGGDSILALQIVSRARAAGIDLRLPQIFAHQTIAALAGVGKNGIGTSGPLKKRTGSVAVPPQAEPEVPVPFFTSQTTTTRLSPIQNWFFATDSVEVNHYAQYVVLDLPAGHTTEQIQKALTAVAARHDVFRLRFERSNGAWQINGNAAQAPTCAEASVDRPSPVPHTRRMISTENPRLSIPLGHKSLRDINWVEEAATASCDFDITAGQFSKAVLYAGEAGPARLLWVIHHLIVDGVSWRILIEELALAMKQIKRGDNILLPGLTDSYAAYANGNAGVPLAQCGPAARASAQEPYDSAKPVESNPSLYRDLHECAFSLRPDETRELFSAASLLSTRPDKLILTAFAAALAGSPGQKDLLIDIERHGRDAAELDLSRTVGWFTKIESREFRFAEAYDARTKIIAAKTALHSEPRSTARAEISFNYLGNLDHISRETGLTLVDAGLSASPARRRPHALEIHGGMRNETLSMTVAYCGKRHHVEEVEELARRVRDELRALVAFAHNKKISVYTPADFGSALTQEALDEILSEPVFARNVADILPLTPVQEGILYHAAISPSREMYVIQLGLRIDGVFDPERFLAAWKHVQSARGVLRTLLRVDRAKNWYQIMLKDADLPVRMIESSDSDVLTEERARGFELADELPYRIVLARASGGWRMALTVHHVLLDGWSMASILGEVVSCYQALGENRPLRLENTASYRQYIDWRARQDVEAAEKFWREELKDCNAAPLPLDARTGHADEQGRIIRALPRELVDRCKSFARDNRVTLNTLAQAAWAILLARYTDADDVVFGTAVSGRPAELDGYARMAGLFINTVPVRASFSDEASLGDWLTTLQDRQRLREEHAHVPLTAIQEWSGRRRGEPLFDTLLVFENYPVEESLRSGGALAFSDVQVLERTHYPLTAVVTEAELTLLWNVGVPSAQSGQDAHAQLHQSSDKAFFKEICDRWISILSQIVSDAPTRVGDLSLLVPHERDAIIRAGSGAVRDYDLTESLIDRFEAQVDRTPDAIALSMGDQRMTYAELDAAANRVAHRLIAEGVARGTYVAVAMERSCQLVIALYGVLKAGAAWVPIDPELPDARIAFLAVDTAAPVILTSSTSHEWISKALKNIPKARPTIIAQDRLEAQDSDSRRPPRETSAEDIAYMIYTSGSTGEPKGVPNSHRGIINRLMWMQETFPLDASDVVLQKTPYTFDVSVWEFFWPLMTGARLAIAPPHAHRDPNALIACIDRERVTTIHFVPSMLRYFTASPRAAGCRSLRRVFVSGEALLPDDVTKFREKFAIELHNLYGPTEAAVDVTWWPAPQGAVTSIPIGRPITNTRVYILDRRGRLLPQGIPGELALGGVQIAVGYHKRPELTAERFRPDPFFPGERIYLTGDRARLLLDGNVEYLGRMDDQVKIRGQRVELGEIETALLECAGVADAAAAVHNDAQGETILVGYVVGANPDVALIRKDLAARLAAAVIPSHIVTLAELPRLSSGKIDRKVLGKSSERAIEKLTTPKLVETRGARHAVPVRADGNYGTIGRAGAFNKGTIERALLEIWKVVLECDEIRTDENFFDLGGHSLKLIRVQGLIEEQLGVAIPVTELFEYPTVAALARRIMPEGGKSDVRTVLDDERRTMNDERRSDIAVIGMACRFPGASTINEFWRNLRNGVESVRFFSPDELRRAGIADELIENPHYVPAHAVLDRVEEFDAGLFDYPPREAELIDPQQRLFLECAWEVLENAGYAPNETELPVGVFGGAAMNTYVIDHIAKRPDVVASAGGFQLMITNDKDYLATRVSYKLNLRGPSVNVQTACSTSLVAVYMACESLMKGDCRMAIAGGVSIRLPQHAGYLHEDGMIFSPDGHCRAFDADAQGIVSGSGAGTVLLKRLEDAVADGDTIHAVIRGAAINNDGSGKVGFTAPSVEGQAAVITEALRRAQINPETIGYVEAHGTGTPLGDPIEIAALTRAYRAFTPKAGYCAVGSVKSNIGHLDAGAGVAGLIKAVLSLKYGKIPASLNFTAPNPHIPFAGSPFIVNDRLRDWERGADPRRAAVSSFGLGGTNAHVILEEAPVVSLTNSLDPLMVSGSNRELQRDDTSSSRDHSTSSGLGMSGNGIVCTKTEPTILILSAKTATALEESTDRLIETLADPGVSLQDAAYTLAVGRKRFDHRRFVVAANRERAIEHLAHRDPASVFTRNEPARNRPVAFLFSGMGPQYLGMARGLYEREPLFREAIDHCAEILSRHVDFDIRRALWPDSPEDSTLLDRIDVIQPVNVAFGYAVATLWRRWGIEPDVMIGHSLGEYIAACLAGVVSLEDVLFLAAERGRLMRTCRAGAMLAVLMPEDELRPLLEGDLVIGAVNSPSLSVVSGSPNAVAGLKARLESMGIDAHSVRCPVATHSSHMDPILEEFRAVVERINLTAPTIPFISSVTARWITDEDAISADYWVRHLREPVRFSEGIAALMEDPERILLEVGPGRALSTTALRHPARSARHLIFTSVRHEKDDYDDVGFIRASLGHLWLAGAPVDWTRVYAGPYRRIPLPTYPFERQRLWIDPPDPSELPATRNRDRSEWVALPSWERSLAPRIPDCGMIAAKKWLIFTNGSEVDHHVIEKLRDAGAKLTVVESGSAFGRTDDSAFALRPGAREDYAELFASMNAESGMPDVILHLWNLGSGARNEAVERDIRHSAWGDQPVARTAESRDRSFFSLIALAQALGECSAAHVVTIAVASSRVHRVTGDEILHPERALLLGPVRVIPQEYEKIRCVNVDVAEREMAEHASSIASDLIGEALSETFEPIIALRNGSRWTESAVPQRLDQAESLPLKANGTYLITGGLGGVGGELAEWLARHVEKPNLILVTRTPLAQTNSESSPPDPLIRIMDIGSVPSIEWNAECLNAERIALVARLKASGAHVEILSVDVGDASAFASALSETRARFGGISGIIHAAGIAGGGIIATRGRVDAEAEFRSKVAGVDELLANLDQPLLDFIVFCSSTNARLGGVGQVAYTSANAYLDAVADASISRSPDANVRPRVISIVWDRWQGTGMGASSETLHEAMTGSPLDGGISVAEATEAFGRVLASGLRGTVIVSPLDFQNAARRSRRYQLGEFLAAAEERKRRDRSRQLADYAAPESELEAAIALIWRRELGIDTLGVRDEFGRLGGDSLLAVRLAAKLRRELEVDVNARTIYEHPTVAALARHVEIVRWAALGPKGKAEELESGVL